MTAKTEALGRCTKCAITYPIYRSDGEWRALGTDGSCKYGNSEFVVLSADESADSA